MSSRKQQHDYARRRYEKWLAHQAAVQARQRRRRVIAGWALGVLALAAGVWLVIELVRGDDGAEPTADPSAAPSAEPTSEPTSEPTEAPTTPDPDVPDPSLAEGRTWTANLSTTVGEITIELDGAAAPQAVAAFLTLAQDGDYEATSCDRLTTSGFFLLECGDPGTGDGAPTWRFGPIENAPVDDVYPAGTVAMDRDPGDPASMGGRFFIVYEDSTIQADSAGGFTVIGRVTEGMDALRLVAAAGIASGTADTPAADVTIEGVEIE